VRALALIAVNVFRESVRDKVLYNLVAFALLLIGASYLIGQLTAGQDVKIIKDLGLAASSMIGLFIAVFFGIGLVTKEVERRSIYSVLSKPITRSQFIVGKYLGLVVTLLINLAVMAVAFYLVLAYLDWVTPANAKLTWEAPALDWRMLKAFGLIGVELMVMTAVTLFFSTFSGSFLSAILAAGVYIVGHFGDDLNHLDVTVQSYVIPLIGRAVYYVMPNLSRLDIKAAVVHGEPISAVYMLATSASSGLYVATLLVAATIIFSRRDLK